MAAAAFVSAALSPTDAAALALGPINVQSALGENLRAEISVPQATAAELNSLAAQIASPEVFRAQGMDYSAAARAIQVEIHRNADGTASLRLRSNAPIHDPFVDLVVQTQWNAGQLVRSYTLLLDPPPSQRSAPAPTVAPQVAPAPTAAPAAATGRTYSSTAAAPRAPAVKPAVPATPKAPAAAEDASVRVRTGDTAGRIANANRPAGVSLDQMLVAMLRSNPNAFINGNVNRIRAGSVLQVPNREQALETSASEARQIVAAQSRDFNAYRRSLASKAPQATVQAADRTSSGQVQAHVEETRPAADNSDKLTLSKGSVQHAAAEEKLAAQKQADDQGNRLSELQRNLAELNELAQNTPATPAAPAQEAAPVDAAPTAPAAAADTPAATPSVDVPNAAAAAATEASAAPAEPPPSTEADTAAAPAPEEASTAPAAEPVKPKPVAPPPAPVQEPSLVDDLLGNELIPAAGGLLALLLAALGYTAWKRRRAAQAAQDPSLGDSQLQPDSFFGSSGGQQVDTSTADAGASTMAYSPSQLDGGGDVDPVAEADVYLAYGRDVQAEEILKESLRTQPERLSTYVKLAEIYVKRHDIKALEGIARSMQSVSQSSNPEWQRVVEMGRHMDPTHPFFAAASTGVESNSAQPTSAFAAALHSLQPEASNAAIGAAAAGAAMAAAAPAQAAPEIDLHLDLPDNRLAHTSAPAAPAIPTASVPVPSDDDFAALELPSTLDSQLDVTAGPDTFSPPTLVQDTQIVDAGVQDLSGLDLDISGFEIPAPQAPSAPAAEAPAALDDGLNFDLELPGAEEPAAAASAALEPEEPAAPAAPSADAGLEFDLGSLDLDLGPTAEPAAPAQPVHNLTDDPLSTKLDLAQEFNSIGDSEGARALIEEVLAEATGPLKERAQKMLSEID